MLSSITARLSFAMLSLTVVVLAATLALSWWSFRNGFLEYINAQERERLQYAATALGELYQRNGGSWRNIDEATILATIRRHDSRPRPRPPSHRDRPPRHGPLASREGKPERERRGAPSVEPRQPPPTWLVSSDERLLAGRTASGDVIVQAVVSRGQVVAELRTQARTRLGEPLQLEFASQQVRNMALTALAAIALAIAVSVLLSQALLAPIRRIIRGVDTLAAGRYDVQFEDQRRDELGELARDLDRLATSLASTQSARQRWLADLSHELRTPLAVLRAEIDAVKDGVRPLTHDRMRSLSQEVERLGRLVDDLYDLSVSDLGGLRYEFSEVDLQPLLQGLVSDFSGRFAELEFELSCPQDLLVRADPQRLSQMLINLLENSAAYTDAPGRVELSAELQGRHVRLQVADSPPGVAPEMLQHLFEPLFRQEDARDRRSGGAGLGLAICANIAEAHGSRLDASASGLGGLAISCVLERA